MQRIGLVGITNILVAISSIILLPILTKSFSTSDYGIWVQIMTTISLIPFIATLGLPYTMVRFLSSEKNKEKVQEGFYSIAGIVFIFTIIISLFLFLFSGRIASILFNDNINLVIILSVITLFACLNSFLLNFFRTFQQMKRYSVFLLIQTYLGLLFVSYLALNGFNINLIVLGYLIANIITFFLMIPFIIHSIGFKSPEFKNIREYLSFGLPTIPSNLSYWIVDSSDRYVIGILLGTTFVGYYSPGYTLGNIIIMILAPFSLLLPSVLPKYYEENNIEKVKLFLNYSLKYFLLIAIPAVFGLSLLSKQLLMLLTTPEIALNGYMITPLVALSSLILGIYGIIVNILILNKRTKVIGILWIIAAFFNLFLNILLVPYLGIIGAAYGTLVAYTIALFLTILYSFKLINIGFELDYIIKSVIASIIMSSVILFTNPMKPIPILIIILISAIFYFILLLLFKSISKQELTFFKNLIK